VKRISFYVVSVLIALSFLLSACGGATAKKLKVASDATFPPFESVDEKTKEIVGFDVDLIKAVAAKAGIQIEIQNVPFDPLLAGVATCQYDLGISAVTITEERKKDMAFSDPYVKAGQIVTVKKDNTTIKGPADLVGKKIGAQLSTTGEIEAKKIANTTVKAYDTYDLAFLDLANGQLDAVIADFPTALDFVNKNAAKLKTVGDVFTDENYGIIVCKKNTDLLAKINKGLADVKADGTLAKINDKWLAVSK
jgi:polar amino acid transport system substrate-binding protein